MKALELIELARLVGPRPSRLRIAGQQAITAVLCTADFNFDGVVGAADLAQLLGNWGVCPE